MVQKTLTLEPLPKIVVPVRLTDESKKRLSDFLEGNIAALNENNQDAKRELQTLIQNTFPPETLETLKKIFQGKSKHALLIRNCPERTGFEHQEKPQAKDTYSYHIGKALYEMNGAIHLGARMLTRASHRFAPIAPQSAYIHRDLASQDTLLTEGEAQPVDSVTHHGEYVIFASPYNGEHARTQIINMPRAILSIPVSLRNKIRVNVKMFDMEQDIDNITLNQLLQFIRTVPPGKNLEEQAIFPVPDQDPELVQVFLTAMQKFGVKVDMQPGDLLVVNEGHIFHCAHTGIPEAIRYMPAQQLSSRVFMHNAGAPVTQR